MNYHINILPYDAKKFIEWLNDAKPGDSYVYYRGFVGESKSNYLSTIKETVWKAAVNGHVYLLQKKLGPSHYDYIAQKVNKRKQRLIPWDYFHQGKMPHMLRKSNG